MKNDKKPELLSPAGSMDSLKAAVNSGCDAVYLGGRNFSARQFAGNFDIAEIKEACEYCHLRGVKVYVTVNTLYKDNELESLLEFAGELYLAGADALIVQDMGAAALINRNYPDFELHASTQLTANSSDDVRAMINNGFKRVVLSRELSLNEICSIIEKTGADIETFVHGALCVSYSGQCIMSSMLGGRSGNRGRCAQTCRLPFSLYNKKDKLAEGHLLSTKDMQALTLLPELINAGVSSFKIEGRMKGPEYVGGVTSIYRKYIDLCYSGEKYEIAKSDIKILEQLFNRGGFSEGYFKSHSGLDMMSPLRPKTWGLKAGIVDSYNPKIKRAVIRTREPLVPGDGIEIWTQTEPHSGTGISKASRAGEVISVTIDGDISKNDVVYKTYDKALNDALKAAREKDGRKQEIDGRFTAKAGRKISLELWDGHGNLVYAEGAIAELAKNQPVTLEKLDAQLRKTGSTPFVLDNLDIDADDGIFISVSELNELRRNAVEKLAASILKSYSRKAHDRAEYMPGQKTLIKRKRLSVHINNIEQLKPAAANASVDRIYIELCESIENNLSEALSIAKGGSAEIFVALPRISRENSTERLHRLCESLGSDECIDGFLARSCGELDVCGKYGKKIAVDYNMNIFNNETMSIWEEKADTICLSPELNLKEINMAGGDKAEMLVYGYLPLMTTHQCPIGAFDGGKGSGIHCSRKGSAEIYYLKDRRGADFPLMTDCRECVCQILNSKPLYTLKFFDEILQSATSWVRLSFTLESARQTELVIEAYAEAVKYGGGEKSRALTSRIGENNNATKGHFFRGVE